jgi:hypothetical protein
MVTTEQVVLIRSAAAALIYDNRNFTPISALDEITKILEAIKTGDTNHLARYPFFKKLVDAEVKAETIEEVKAPKFSQDVIQRTVGVCGLIRRLKFSQEEMFHILTSTKQSDILKFEILTESMRTFVSRVSQGMTLDGLTMNEAIANVLNPGANRHYSRISQEDMKLLLSPQTIFELHLHAKAKLVLNVDNYEPKRFDEKALVESARFHVEHQDKVYWATDKTLGILGFKMKEITPILIANANLTLITALSEKANAMINLTIKIEDMMQSVNKMSFEQAKKMALQDQTIRTTQLTEQEFSELLSPEFNSSLQLGIFNLFNKGEVKYSPLFPRTYEAKPQQQPLPIDINQFKKFTPGMRELPDATSQTSHLLAGISNPTVVLSFTGGALFVLAMLCYCKPRMLFRSVSLLCNASNKVLGCFNHPKKSDEKPKITHEKLSHNRFLYYP